MPSPKPSWHDILPNEFHIGKDVWRVEYVPKRTIKIDKDKCWGGCWFKERIIRVCIGTKSKPVSKKRIVATLWHEYGHAVAESLGFKKRWKEAREKAEEKVCAWLGEKIAHELDKNHLL